MDALTIIVADDHPLFREGMEQALLRLQPLSTIYTVSGKGEVHELLHEKLIDLVFLDIGMRGINGLEEIKNIRGTDTRVKIIAVTMSDDPDTINQISNAGANGFLHKNAENCKLEELINGVFSMEFYMPADKISRNIVAPATNPSIHHDPDSRNHLSEREIEILKLICNQFSSREIASLLHLTEKTVETHRNHLMMKTQSRNVVGLTMFAIAQGYFSPEQRKRI